MTIIAKLLFFFLIGNEDCIKIKRHTQCIQSNKNQSGDLRLIGQEETCALEKTVYFQRAADHSYKKCLGQYAHLPNVYLPYA